MEDIRKQLEKIVEEVFDVKTSVNVTVAPENTGADYATNVAMQLAKLVHKNPMVIAEMIADELSGRITSFCKSFPDVPVASSASSSSSSALLARRMSNTSRSVTLDSSNKLEDFNRVRVAGDSSRTLSQLDSSDANGKQDESKEKPMFTVEVVAPGFINFLLDEAAMIEKARDLAKAGEIENLVEKKYHDKTVVAEFSDPNPFKVLHVGHLYTSVVGDSISRLLEIAGAKVVRANFGGDVGLHVAKTLYAVGLFSERNSFSPRITSLKSAAAPSSYPKYDSVRCSTSPRTSSEITSSLKLEDKDSSNKLEDFNRVRKANNTSRISSQMALSGELQKKRDNDLSDKSAELKDLTIEDIARSYVEGTRAYDEDEAAKAEITRLNKEIYRINAEDLHDSELAQLYWRGRELSYEYFRDFYKRIGVKFDKYYPESSVAERGLMEVRAHTGTTYEESDGAVVYKGEKVGLHTRVFINREGVPTYEAKDVGLIFTKWDDWHFDESVVVTGNEQSDYMKVVLASVSEYAPKLVERTTHLTHGLVKLPGNVKMSSRKGNFLKAVDVLQLVEDLFSKNKSSGAPVASSASSSSSSALLSRRMSNTACSVTLDSSNKLEDFNRVRRAGESPRTSSKITSSLELEKEEDSLNKLEDFNTVRVAGDSPRTSSKITSSGESGKEVKLVDERLVLAAIKYAFLKYKMGGDIVFDPQESISTTGNSGIYLLYSAVRAKKILGKCGNEKVVETADVELEKSFEKQLSKKMIQYADVLNEAIAEKAPYKVCNYLYELSQEFSRFYEHVRVAGNPREEELKLLVQAYYNIMKNGLGLLGIEIPENM